MRISDWSSDVCSSDLRISLPTRHTSARWSSTAARVRTMVGRHAISMVRTVVSFVTKRRTHGANSYSTSSWHARSEEHTSELQSLMRISYAVFCLKKKNKPAEPRLHTHMNRSDTSPAHTTKV